MIDCFPLFSTLPSSFILCLFSIYPVQSVPISSFQKLRIVVFVFFFFPISYYPPAFPFNEIWEKEDDRHLRVIIDTLCLHIAILLSPIYLFFFLVYFVFLFLRMGG